jgi:putative glutathione S-transferase
MGRLIDGDWRPDVTNDATEAVDLEPTVFDGAIREGGPHPPDPERYHLYVSWACPWAHGTLLTRALLGLQDEVSISVVDPHREDDGWAFTPEKSGCTRDHVHGSDYLHEVYTAADPAYTGRVSVPVLWDREAETIVSDESADIMRTLASAFGGTDRETVALYPAGRRDAIDDVIDALYEPLNRGVYDAGFAPTQSAYEDAVAGVFDALDRWEAVLADQRYLLGDELTLADLRLFATLVRFDAVYHTHFKCTVRRIVDYANLWGFTRDVYQQPGVADTVNLDHIKEHYYRSHGHLNPTGFVPVGPDLAFDAPHDRASSTTDQKTADC